MFLKGILRQLLPVSLQFFLRKKLTNSARIFAIYLLEYFEYMLLKILGQIFARHNNLVVLSSITFCHKTGGYHIFSSCCWIVCEYFFLLVFECNQLQREKIKYTCLFGMSPLSTFFELICARNKKLNYFLIAGIVGEFFCLLRIYGGRFKVVNVFLQCKIAFPLNTTEHKELSFNN